MTLFGSCLDFHCLLLSVLSLLMSLSLKIIHPLSILILSIYFLDFDPILHQSFYFPNFFYPRLCSLFFFWFFFFVFLHYSVCYYVSSSLYGRNISLCVTLGTFRCLCDRTPSDSFCQSIARKTVLVSNSKTLHIQKTHLLLLIWLLLLLFLFITLKFIAFFFLVRV